VSARRATTRLRHRSTKIGASFVPRFFRKRYALRRRKAAGGKLEQIASSDLPVIAGPWTGGVGMELLYWIPMLGWLTTKGGVDPSRVVAVSRGGAEPWYSKVAGQYVDLLDHFTLGEVREWHEERLHHPGNELHIGIHTHDHRAFDLARELTGEPKAEWVHPLLMHRLFSPRWEYGAPGSSIWSHTAQRLLPEHTVDLPELPERYLALKAYFSPWFPDTEENRRILHRLIEILSERVDVVLLRVPSDVEEHGPFVPEPGAPVIDLCDRLDPRTNLAVQTAIVRDALVLVATYGGFSYLGTYVGTPTIALYTHARFQAAHLDSVDRVGRRLAQGRTRLFRARHIGALPAGARAD
jgi:hypothetical protein